VQLLPCCRQRRDGREIEKDVADRASALGIEVTEVRLHRADLRETSQAIYDRMTPNASAKPRIACTGLEWAQQIQAKADSERTVLLSKRSAGQYHSGERCRCQPDSTAASQGPQFYRLYRSCRRTGNRWPTRNHLILSRMPLPQAIHHAR